MTHISVTYLKESVPVVFVFRNVWRITSDSVRLFVLFDGGRSVLDASRVREITLVDEVV